MPSHFVMLVFLTSGRLEQNDALLQCLVPSLRVVCLKVTNGHLSGVLGHVVSCIATGVLEDHFHHIHCP